MIAKGQRLIVAVDGPAGAGKGAVCRAVAQQCGFHYLDTGALYRAVSLLSRQKETTDPQTLARLAADMAFTFRVAADGTFRAFLDGLDVSEALRAEEVGGRASQVASVAEVRHALLTFQRRYGDGQDTILDGRDTGTVVWPDADLKLFLTASLEERAKRRALELQQKGEPVSFASVRDKIAERDQRDSQREEAPLRQAADAVRLDTTHLTLEESIHTVVGMVQKVVGNRPR